MSERTNIAIIGGTGLDEMPDFTSGETEAVTTRFGTVQVVRCTIGGGEVLFLPRHGVTHSILPHNLNYRAQIAGLKKIGAKRILGLCSVGSLRADIPPGTLAVLRDFIDFTKRRESSFFEAAGSSAHTDFTTPYCPRLSDLLVNSCRSEGISCVDDAVYVGVEGPRYESPAEVRMFASWGGSVVGMTNVPEVVLAREAGICYGALAVVTNYASGLSRDNLHHDEVRKSVNDAAGFLYTLIQRFVEQAAGLPSCACSLYAPDPGFFE